MTATVKYDEVEVGQEIPAVDYRGAPGSTW